MMERKYPFIFVPGTKFPWSESSQERKYSGANVSYWELGSQGRNVGTCESEISVRIKSSSSRMHVIYHNWSATKQCPHPQSVAEISRHSVLSKDRIRQCETSSGSRHKDTDQCLIVAISFCRHRSVPQCTGH